MVVEDSILVDAVRSRRELYDKGHPGFKVVAIKDAAWIYVSEVVSAPSADCAARWHTLRERYNKEKRRLEIMSRSGSAGGSTVNNVWNLYESMKFLEPFIRKRKGVDNLSSATTNNSPDLSQLFGENGQFIVYVPECEENGNTVHHDQSRFETDGLAEGANGVDESGSSTESSVSSARATPEQCAATPQRSESTSQGSGSTSQTNNLQNRNIPGAAASLPYLGPTSRPRKRKNDDEATAFLKETLSALTKSLSQTTSQDTVSSQHQILDPDSCIAKNVESSLRNLPSSLKLMYRRKFRELLQECEEATVNYQQEQLNNDT